jgi:RimJ/RimL family protein N-acetyltransferase
MGAFCRFDSVSRVPADFAPVSLQGERIRLREVSPDDAPAAFQWSSDPEVFRFMAYDVMATVEEEAAFLSDIAAQSAAQPRTLYDLGIEIDEHGLVGMARLNIRSLDHRHAELGYCLRRDAWGRGYATEAAGLLLELAFTHVGLHRVSAFHDPRNAASGRVMQKLGMQREGVLRENVFAHGRWRDSIAYAILEPDWRAQTTTA